MNLNLRRLVLPVILSINFFGCTKEWTEPDLYTVNLTLSVQPDSVDANHVYYYSNGMKLQMHLKIVADGNTIKDEAWINQTNLHLDNNYKSVTVSGNVIKLS